MRVNGPMYPREGCEEADTVCSGWGGTWELIEGDDCEGGYGEGSGDLSSADWDRGAGVCEYPGGEGVGSIYPEGKDQGEYPVGVVLYGSQYWEDYELWVCLEGMKEEKYIKIRQNISWNRIGSKIMVRNSWKSVLTAECFFKKLGFSTASLYLHLFSDHRKCLDMLFIY